MILITYDVENTTYGDPDRQFGTPSPFSPNNRLLLEGFGRFHNGDSRSWSLVHPLSWDDCMALRTARLADKGQPLLDAITVAMLSVPTTAPANFATGTAVNQGESHLLDVLEGARTADSDLILAGHNIAYDLLWALTHMKRRPARELLTFLRCHVQVWDTALAGFLLSGQEFRTPSLEYLCQVEGVSNQKIAAFKDFFKDGGSLDMLSAAAGEMYLAYDIAATQELALRQIKQAQDLNMLPFLLMRMDFLCATTEMTFNGLPISKTELAVQRHDLEARLKGVCASLQSAADMRGWSGEFNPASQKQLLTILNGGQQSIEERVQIGEYKNGKPRFAKQATTRQIPEWVPGGGVISTDARTLAEVRHTHTAAPGLCGFITDVLEFREISKIISTYIDGWLTALGDDNILHPQYNHTIARTTRLSSSGPNLQNVPATGVKKAAVTLFPDERYVEVDYGQIEICVLAIITGDKQLQADLRDGKDIHTEVYRQAYGRAPTKAERKAVKRVVFGMIYGAGVASLAVNADLSEAETSKLVKSFRQRYPDTVTWVKQLSMDAEADGRHLGHTSEGLPVRTFQYTGRGGMRYTFHEEPWRTHDGKLVGYEFSKPQLSNTEIQGYATGGLVPSGIANIWRWLGSRHDVMLCGTTHDSVMFRLPFIEKFAYKFRETIYEVCTQMLSIVMDDGMGNASPVPISVEVASGPNWGELSPLLVVRQEPGGAITTTVPTTAA